MKPVLEPSVLSADFAILGEQTKLLQEIGIRSLHYDVMDGSFVPSISFGMPVIKCIRPHTNLFFDVHLMIENPERYLDAFAGCGADGITIHMEERFLHGVS